MHIELREIDGVPYIRVEDVTNILQASAVLFADKPAPEVLLHLKGKLEARIDSVVFKEI